jgi:hypothetical protein
MTPRYRCGVLIEPGQWIPLVQKKEWFALSKYFQVRSILQALSIPWGLFHSTGHFPFCQFCHGMNG